MNHREEEDRKTGVITAAAVLEIVLVLVTCAIGGALLWLGLAAF